MPSLGPLTHYQQKVVADIVVELFPQGADELSSFLTGARFDRLHNITNVRNRFTFIVLSLVEDLYSKGNLERFLDALRSTYPNAPALADLDDAIHVLGSAQSEQRVAKALDGGFEAIVSGNGLHAPLDWARRLLQLSRSVCHISVGVDGDAKQGSGVLVAPDTVLTAFHVVESLFAAGADPRSVRVTFDTTARGSAASFTLARDWKGAASPHQVGLLGDQNLEALDFSFLKLSEPATGRTPIDIAAAPSSDRAVVVIQHPGGGAQRLSIGAVLTNSVSSLIRYDADTLPGSSGGLVVTSGLEPLAVHHYGSRSEGYNQGIPLVEIARAAQAARFGHG